MTDESHDLHVRNGLPAEFRYLEAGCARQDWPGLKLHETASHWLEIHGWFRGMLRGLIELGGERREGRLDPAAYRADVMPRLRQFLGNLDGHHHIESDSYFPALAALEPAMKRGFDLLDRDHEAIHELMSQMADAANALNHAAVVDLNPHADGLIAAIDRAAPPIGRHLSDEEEIIVPVLTLRGDPFRDARP
jgi:hypothetical protein